MQLVAHGDTFMRYNATILKRYHITTPHYNVTSQYCGVTAIAVAAGTGMHNFKEISERIFRRINRKIRKIFIFA